MARLGPDEQLAVREAVDRQSRGAVAVRPAQNTTAAVNVSQVAEVEAKADLHEEAGPPQPPAPAESAVAGANGGDRRRGTEMSRERRRKRHSGAPGTSRTVRSACRHRLPRRAA
jgi:hypothetical protein